MKGFRNFMTRGDIVVVSVGLVVALAFSGLIKAFTTGVIDPIVNRAQGTHPIALGVQLGAANNTSTFLNIGTFISAIVYFVIFVAVVYFVMVVPYRHAQARRGMTVFGPPPPAKSCPYCLSDDLPVAATKCKYCASVLPGPTGAPSDAAAGAPVG
ncbi:MAG TPA: MscL family protein [Acidimicrobiales bacterium]|nr:MscL family protein [Acidimicrobiales bacterium]